MQIFALPAVSLHPSLKRVQSLRREWELPCRQSEERNAVRLMFDISSIPTHSLSVCQMFGTLTISGLRPISTDDQTDAEIACERFTVSRALPAGFDHAVPEITLSRDFLIVRLSR
jgi:hypothetical protein